MPGLGGVVLELAPQLRDVRVHRSAHDDGAMPPDLAHELLARSDGALSLEQREEQLEFHGCEIDRDTLAGDRARGAVYLDLAESLGGRRGLWTRGAGRAAQEGLDAAICDFVAGMTDRYAIRLFEQLFIPKPWAEL